MDLILFSFDKGDLPVNLTQWCLQNKVALRLDRYFWRLRGPFVYRGRSAPSSLYNFEVLDSFSCILLHFEVYSNPSSFFVPGCHQFHQI